MNDPTAARIHQEIATLLQAKDQLQQQLSGIENQLLVLGRVLEPIPEPKEKPK